MPKRTKYRFPVYLCHGCRRRLSIALVIQSRTTHRGCEAEAMRKFEVSEARREGIPVAVFRERRETRMEDERIFKEQQQAGREMQAPAEDV